MTWGVLNEPVAAVVFDVAVLVFAVNEARVERLSRRRSAASVTSSLADRGSKAALMVAFAAGVVAAFAARGLWPELSFGAGALGWAAYGIGLVLVLAATAGRVWAVRTLGRWFTTNVRTDTEQTVVEHGPYRWVRHPSYTSALMCMLGIGLAVGNFVSAVCFVVLPLIGFVFRIRVEEQALLGQLGPAYERYAAGHRRLVPGVW